MEKIGFFGGCFNPPNNIHLNIANSLINEGKLDKVIFVPVNDSYNKNGLIDLNHRCNMLKLLINNNKKLELDDIEIKYDKRLYAIDIFEIINIKYNDKNNDIFMIMGSDNYSRINDWKDYNKLKDNYKYIVIKRNNDEISSSDIRKMIKEKDDRVREYLPYEIYKYILENKLYRDD